MPASLDTRAHCAPVGSHLMALTSSLWPSKVLRGCVSPSLHTWIILSVLQVAKEVLFLQSTSSVGAAGAVSAHQLHMRPGTQALLRLCPTSEVLHWGTLVAPPFSAASSRHFLQLWPMNAFIPGKLHTAVEGWLQQARVEGMSQQGASLPNRQLRGGHAPVWNSNCCLTSPVRPSQMMAVLSTEPDSSRSPFLFHFSEKMGPRWLFSVFFSSPAGRQEDMNAACSRAWEHTFQQATSQILDA